VVHVETKQLLGGHVRRRALVHTLQGQRCTRICSSGRARHGHGDAEVEYFHRAIGHDLNVRRFEIAMDDAGAMCGGERLRQRLTDFDDAHDRHRLAAQHGGKALTRDVLHDDEGAAVMLDDVVDAGDARVGDACRRSRLVNDPVSQIVASDIARQDTLERDEPIEARVLCEKHFAHATAAKAIEHDVWTDEGAARQAGGLVTRPRAHGRGSGSAVFLDQRDKAVPKRGIGTRLVQEALALHDRALERGSDEGLSLRP
jgi:hypothetical protein